MNNLQTIILYVIIFTDSFIYCQSFSKHYWGIKLYQQLHDDTKRVIFLFCFYGLTKCNDIDIVISAVYMWILPTEKNENNTNYIK